MMNWYGAVGSGGSADTGLIGLFMLLFWIFSFIDVVLLAFYLWRQLMKR